MFTAGRRVALCDPVIIATAADRTDAMIGNEIAGVSMVIAHIVAAHWHIVFRAIIHPVPVHIHQAVTADMTLRPADI